MANLRLIYKNVIDTAATLTASTTSGGLVASNMQNDYKGKAHRSTTTSVTYTATWATTQNIGGVVLPATNLSGSATVRVRLYNTGGTVQIADSGTINACPGNNIELWNWSGPLNANAFIFGGASKTAVWFSSHYAADKIVVDLVDTTNAAGYIDCSRLIAGAYWEPKYNVSNGISVEISDTSTTERADSGDLVATRGTVVDRLSFDFSVLEEADRTSLTQILRAVGTSRNILVSVFPDNNSLLEQSHMVYGKRSNSSINASLYGIYKHSMELEGW